MSSKARHQLHDRYVNLSKQFLHKKAKMYALCNQLPNLVINIEIETKNLDLLRQQLVAVS